MNKTHSIAILGRSWIAVLMIVNVAAAGTYIPQVHYLLHGDQESDFLNVAFSADSHTLYAVNSNDGAIYRWQTATQQPMDPIIPPTGSSTIVIAPAVDLAISVGSKDETYGKYFFWKLSDSSSIASISGERDDKFLAVSSDGRVVATHRGTAISLWSLPQGSRQSSLNGHAKEVILAKFSLDGKFLASTGYEDPIRLWDVERGQALGSLEEPTRAMTFSPDGNFLFANKNNTILVWDVRLRVPVARFMLTASIQDLSFSADEKRLVVVDNEGTNEWHYDSSQFESAKPATANERLAMLSPNLREQRYKELPQLTFNTISPGFRGSPFATSPDGRWLASGNSGVRLWDEAASDLAESTKPRRVLMNPDRVPKAADKMAFSPDGRQIAAFADYDDAVDVWDVSSGKHLRSWNNDKLTSELPPSLSADGKLLAVVCRHYNDSVVVWDTTTGRTAFTADFTREFYERLRRPWEAARTSESCPIVFSPNGTALAWVAPWDNHVALYDVVKRKPIRQFLDPTRISPDRKSLISDGEVTTIAFSRDGQMLAAGYSYGMVKLWDANTGKWLKNFVDPDVTAGDYRDKRSHENKLIDVAVLSDGHVASMDNDCLKIWNIQSGEIVTKLNGTFWSLSFALDEQTFATGPQIWDRSTLRQRAYLKDCVEDFNDIAFSPDGAHLAVSSSEGVVLFDPEPFQGLFHTPDITQENVHWLGQTLTRMGYLNPETGLRAATYRAAEGSHIALTLPRGAAADEIIVASIRDEVGPVLAERIGPKLAIHLCTETFQIERTIEVERPLVAVPSAPVANLIAPVSTSAEPASVEAASTTDDLQGAWRVKQFRFNGRLTKFNKATVYRFREGKLIVETNAAPSAEFTYSVDSLQTPAQLDLVLKKPGGDVVSSMIYKIVGDVLTIGYATPGGSRPTDFDPSPGQNRTMITFVRIKEDVASTGSIDSPVSLVTPPAISGNQMK